MRRKTFYKANAIAWIVLMVVTVEPLAKAVTTPGQFALTMAIEAFVGYLAFASCKFAMSAK